MKGKVNCFLNIRTGKPGVNEPNVDFYKPGDEVEIRQIVKGDPFENSKLWYELADGSFVWSGGVDVSSKDEIPSAFKRDWWLDFLNIREIWQTYQVRGEGVNIAVLDTGISTTLPQVFDYGKVAQRPLTVSGKIDDTVGHGSNVASILTSQNAMVTGIAPGSRLTVIKVVEKKFQEDPLLFIKAAEAIKADPSIDVVSMSYSFSGKSIPPGFEVIDELGKTKYIVCSCGNTGNRMLLNRFPASYPNIISVGATDDQNKIYPQSTRSEHIDLVAPGVDINAYGKNIGLDYNLTGTSFSTPIVAGVIALMISYIRKERKDPAKFKLDQLLKDTATRVPGMDAQLYGAGVLNPKMAFEILTTKLKLL